MANEEPKQEENKEQENESKGQPSAEQKAKRLEQENESLKEQLATANQQIKDFTEKLEKALTEDDVTKAVQAAKDEAEKAQTEAASKAAAREKRLTVENELIKANCIDTKGALAHIDLDGIEIAQDGHVSGLDIAKLAEDNAHLFQQANTQKVSSAGTPSGNGKQMTKDEIMAIKEPSKRRKAIEENIALFE